MMYFDWFSCRLRAGKTPSDPSVLPFGIKTRTCLGCMWGEVVMAGDEGLRVELAEDHQQFFQPFALAGRTGIGRMPVRVESALVADTDGTMVQTFYMGTHLTKQARVGGGSVGTDVKMITGRAKTSAPVVAFQLFGCIRPIATGGGTVAHDKADTISGMAHEFDLALQDGFADRNHGYKQDWSPKAPKRVATTVAITFNTIPQILCLGFSGAGLASMVCCMCL